MLFLLLFLRSIDVGATVSIIRRIAIVVVLWLALILILTALLFELHVDGVGRQGALTSDSVGQVTCSGSFFSPLLSVLCGLCTPHHPTEAAMKNNNTMQPISISNHQQRRLTSQ